MTRHRENREIWRWGIAIPICIGVLVWIYVLWPVVEYVVGWWPW